MQVSPQRFSADALALVADSDHEFYLSAASAWEIAFKWTLGKLPLPQPPAEYLPRCLERQGVLGLPLQLRHALHVASLPPHHGDPFDRLLVAQAQIEELTFLTADRQLGAYEEVEILWA